MNSPLSEMDSNYFKNDVVGTVNGCIQNWADWCWFDWYEAY